MEPSTSSLTSKKKLLLLFFAALAVTCCLLSWSVFTFVESRSSDAARVAESGDVKAAEPLPPLNLDHVMSEGKRGGDENGESESESESESDNEHEQDEHESESESESEHEQDEHENDFEQENVENVHRSTNSETGESTTSNGLAQANIPLTTATIEEQANPESDAETSENGSGELEDAGRDETVSVASACDAPEITAAVRHLTTETLPLHDQLKFKNVPVFPLGPHVLRILAYMLEIQGRSARVLPEGHNSLPAFLASVFNGTEREIDMEAFADALQDAPQASSTGGHLNFIDSLDLVVKVCGISRSGYQVPPLQKDEKITIVTEAADFVDFVSQIPLGQLHLCNVPSHYRPVAFVVKGSASADGQDAWQLWLRDGSGNDDYSWTAYDAATGAVNRDVAEQMAKEGSIVYVLCQRQQYGLSNEESNALTGNNGTTRVSAEGESEHQKSQIIIGKLEDEDSDGLEELDRLFSNFNLRDNSA